MFGAEKKNDNASIHHFFGLRWRLLFHKTLSLSFSFHKILFEMKSNDFEVCLKAILRYFNRGLRIYIYFFFLRFIQLDSVFSFSVLSSVYLFLLKGKYICVCVCVWRDRECVCVHVLVSCSSGIWHLYANNSIAVGQFWLLSGEIIIRLIVNDTYVIHTFRL